MTRRLNLLILCLLLIFGAPPWYLLIDSNPWSAPARRLDMAEMRRFAAEQPGDAPLRVEYRQVAWRRVPGNVFAAGSGFKRRLISIMAFRVVYANGSSIMIETGTTPQYARELGMESFDAAAQASVDTAMRGASAILVTHEHGDHLGGLARLAGAPGGGELLAKARLNRHQVPAGKTSTGLPWPPGLRADPGLNDAAPQSVAPGVMVIPTPGHTPGSQMIFVRLQNGTEFLFAGDTATMAVSWKEQRPPSRLVTDFYAPQNRSAVIGWLKALEQIKTENPALVIVPGHDLDWIEDPRSKVPMQRMADPPPLAARYQEGASQNRAGK